MTVDTAVRFRTHGKVNLFLRVVGKRSDGYHEVETILQVINLADKFEVAVTSDEAVRISMTLGEGLVGELPDEHANLIRHAVDRLMEAGSAGVGADIRVTKNIPLGAGLGGGSGNAAGALVVLSETWGLKIDRSALIRMAGAIGSDVPYCIDGGTALATGRGEQLTRLPSLEEIWFVLGGMNYPLATKDVYEKWGTLAPAPDVNSAPMTLALGAGDVAEVAALLHNDLEAAALVLKPELREKKAVLRDAGSLGACMSGSGPTMYGIARDESDANAIAGRIQGEFDWVRVVSSQSDCIVRD